MKTTLATLIVSAALSGVRGNACNQYSDGGQDACAAASDAGCEWEVEAGTGGSCEAKPVLLAQPGNSCPEGYTTPGSKNGCKTALQAIGSQLEHGKFEGTEDERTWPRGCYYCEAVEDCSNGVWFNAHSTGSSNGGARPICTYGDGTPPPPSPSPFDGVLFVGDSDVSRWNTDVDFPGSQNVGVGGWTCKKVLSKLGGLISAANPPPQWVVLVCGENDLWGGGTSASATFGRFKRVVAALAAKGIRVVYMGTKPEPDTEALHSKYRQYDALIRAHAADLAGGSSGEGSIAPLVMVDVYPAFETLGNGDALYAKDGLHLSAQGYSHWTGWAQQAMGATDCTLYESAECTGEKPTPAPEKTCDSFTCKPASKYEPVGDASATVCKRGSKNKCTRSQCCGKVQRYCGSVKCKGKYFYATGSSLKKCGGKGQPKCNKSECCTQTTPVG